MHIRYFAVRFFMDWREDLDPLLQEHLQELLKVVSKERQTYTQAKNVSHAQLWCALVLLTRQVSDLQLHVKRLEKQVQQKANDKVKKSMEQF